MSRARQSGVETLDTAVVYGDSERVLGEIGVCDWRVVSKVPTIPDDVVDVRGWMERETENSLQNLQTSQLEGILLHDPTQLHGPRATEIASALEQLKFNGLAARVGVSIQHPARDLPAVLQHMDPGIIQAPLNLLDDAMVQENWAQHLKSVGCEVHVRSAFLQGLLLMKSGDRPAWFDRWSDHWNAWHQWLDQMGISALEACLRYVLAQPDVDQCIVGVETVSQLSDLLCVEAVPLERLPDWPSPPDIDLITPSRWSIA